MERLTFEGRFCDIAVCMEPVCPYPDTGCSQKRVWERLKDYEETGMTAEEIDDMRNGINRLQKLLSEIGIDRLCELAQADKDGRCVVLPCKVGDTVYRIGRECGKGWKPTGKKKVLDWWQVEHIEIYGEETLFFDDSDNSFTEKDIGNTVFLTREEAEAALKDEL